ncbi:MAG: TolC family protein [Prevotellaceae bacterium]|jgi:outer membrane protein TolC|nr:TolC family protein [Prevotellaceae bacterium]
MIKKANAIITVWLFTIATLNAQTLTIDDCYRLAEMNFPLVRQYELLEKSKDFSIENANKAYLPQIGVYGQAGYQSEVTSIPISLPDINIPKPSKDQYKLYGEVQQSVTDLFTTKKQIDLIKANAEAETQKIEVEMYKLREQINSLFFGILLLEAQIKQTELVQKDIQTGLDRTNVAITNGVALKSAADNMQAELLKNTQRAVELNAARKGYADMLLMFVGKPTSDSMLLVKPLPPTISSAINRPELQMFEMQKKAIDAQNSLITIKNMPRLSLFVQGGIGRPGLNMLSDSFDPYYIAGIRLNWNISGLYTYKNERKALIVNKNKIDVQQDIFIFNTNLALLQQNSEILKIHGLLVADNDIILLRESVKNATQARLTFGDVTVNDYITAVNAEDMARQNKILHEIQLLMIQYNAKTASGN